MANKPAPKADNKPVSNGILQPQPTDPLNELYYMLGVLRGANVDGSIRIAELVNQLLAPKPADATTPSEG